MSDADTMPDTSAPPTTVAAALRARAADSPTRIFLRTAAGDWVDAGPVGAPGKDGQTQISADTPNRLRWGSDGGLYVPDDLASDPLAYYILAKA